MAFTTMHLAVGMACSGAIGLAACMVLRRGWRWIPLVMTVGALWAITPDMPRIFREDFPSLGLATTLGSHDLERNLHEWGNVFFFHRQLDAQPNEYALLGTGLMLVFYNASIVGLMVIERKQYDRLNQSYRRRSEHASSRSRLKLLHLNDEDGLEASEQVTRIHQIRSSHLSRSA